MLARALVVLAVFGAACAPSIRDGQYGCVDGSCPPGFRCHADERCHRGPPPTDAGPGTPDVRLDAPVDARPVGYYGECTRDAECESGRCHLGFLPTPWIVGYCSEPCSLGGIDCGSVTGEPYSNCSTAGACELYCVAASQCPLPFRCVGMYREEGTLQTVGTCYPPDQPIAASDAPCSIDSQCTEDLDCIDVDGTAACRRPCTAGYTCAVGETCEDTGANGFYCVP